MRRITINHSYMSAFMDSAVVKVIINQNRQLIVDVLNPDISRSTGLGWIDLGNMANEALISQIEKKAAEIRDRADVFVLIGVGGSNQGSRAALKALGDDTPEIVYTGNTLSPVSMNKVMSALRDRSVYVNVVAKNFATLEPGVAFRTIRHYMEETYGEGEAGKRIIATGSLDNSVLEQMGREKGYTLMPFPLDVGGRFSVLSAVGLLPIAVGGINIRELLSGAADMRAYIQGEPIDTNLAVIYAAYRYLMLQKGYGIEIMSSFEPTLSWFSKWWVQLFGESEGKEGTGIFPTSCSFSEDLHSLGQYIQQGRRMLFETFLHFLETGDSFRIPHEDGDRDGFAYVGQKDFAYLNQIAYESTIKAHISGGVPCISVDIPELSAYYMGQLFYFFEYACYLSGTLLGIDPFDQPGVESYKEYMFEALGKTDN